MVYLKLKDGWYVNCDIYGVISKLSIFSLNSFLFLFFVKDNLVQILRYWNLGFLIKFNLVPLFAVIIHKEVCWSINQ